MTSQSFAIPRGQENVQDDALLVKAARRDPAAFAALYRRYVTAPDGHPYASS